MAYQPTTGERCGCRRGVERDNCPRCEGTGRVIDFAAIRARATAPDVRVENHGSIMVFQPMNDAARAWINEHTDPENRQYWAGGLVVEPRYAADLAAGLTEAGFKVR